MAAQAGQPREFHTKRRFVVEIDSVPSHEFSKCSELSSEIAKTEHQQGGTSIKEKFPGGISFTDVTLERGSQTDDFDLYNWHLQCAAATTSAGLADSKYKRNLDIVQKDIAGKPVVRWRLYGAWPTKYMAGDWDNNSDDVQIESVTLTFERYERLKA